MTQLQLLFTSIFASTKMFGPHADFIEGQEPYGPLQHLVEAKAGPQSQVGAEEVEGGHEVEVVHGDPGDGDLVREGDVDNVGVLTPLCYRTSDYGGGRPLAGNLAARCHHSSTDEVTYKDTENTYLITMKRFVESSSYQFVPKTFRVCSQFYEDFPY